MILRTLLLVLGLLVGNSLQAEKLRGMLILKKDTLEVNFEIPVKLLDQEPNFEKLQKKVKYYDKAGRKVVVRPDDAREIQFNFRGAYIRMISVANNLGLGGVFMAGTNIFLKLEEAGDLKLFNYYFTRQSGGYNNGYGGYTPGHTYSVERYILQKGNGALFRPVGITFKKEMMEYLSDCPVLVKKIESKDFRKSDLVELVQFYNENCGR